MSYVQDHATRSVYDEASLYAQAYEEDSPANPQVNTIEVVYQDGKGEDVAYWAWVPRNTMCLLVHRTPDQEVSYWQQESGEEAGNYVRGVETMHDRPLTNEARGAAYHTNVTIRQKGKQGHGKNGHVPVASDEKEQGKGKNASPDIASDGDLEDKAARKYIKVESGAMPQILMGGLSVIRPCHTTKFKAPNRICKTCKNACPAGEPIPPHAYGYTICPEVQRGPVICST